MVLDIWASHLLVNLIDLSDAIMILVSELKSLLLVSRFLVDACCGLVYWWLYRQRNYGTPDAVFLCSTVYDIPTSVSKINLTAYLHYS